MRVSSVPTIVLASVGIIAGFAGCGGAPPPDPSTTPEPTMPVARPPAPSAPVEGPSADDGAGLSTWIQARLAAARSGRRERVRVPVVYRSAGWGCSCPATFLGTDPDAHNDGDTWLSLEYATGTIAPEDTEDGRVLIVEGHFTGARVREDLRAGSDDPEEYVYTLSTLVVERIVGPAPTEETPRVAVLGSQPSSD